MVASLVASLVVMITLVTCCCCCCCCCCKPCASGGKTKGVSAPPFSGTTWRHCGILVNEIREFWTHIPSATILCWGDSHCELRCSPKKLWRGCAAPVFERIPVAMENLIENTPLATENFFLPSPLFCDFVILINFSPNIPLIKRNFRKIMNNFTPKRRFIGVFVKNRS